ncbi:MAG: phosphoribosylformylglycinamidine synthase subunit PurL [Candidatus Curtissbacteria bacterium]|nr:phosphoribosylformylglycinamidine synthase subunit PurL [Candidatus Curtissbacteria bacterium]
MIHEIRVISKSETDPRGQDLLEEIRRTLKIKSIKNIRTAKVYRLEGVTRAQALVFAQKVLVEPIGQQMSIGRSALKGAAKTIEVAYKPGVMNPEAASLIKAGKDIRVNPKAADSSWEYAFFGKLSQDELAEITERLLVNKTVEYVVKTSPKTLLITGTIGDIKTIPIRNLDTGKLMELSKDKLFLNLEEMMILKNYFQKIKRDPTDCEVETIAQTWSEHCVHKTFKAKLVIDGKNKEPLFSRIKKTVKNNPALIVSAFVDNSGVIDFYDGYAICGKAETHNSPSAIEPYGGAMTGSGGVFRDVLGTGQGAKPIISTDIFCFASPNMPPKLLPPGCLPPDYLLRKVVAGVRDYGNRVGIPTNNGSIHFHNDFRAKPTVAVGAFGLIPKNRAQKGKPKKGDLILTLGGRTGRDGIHGATFSSGEMTSQTISVSGSAVQIGNAIEEKRVIDTIIHLRDLGLIVAVTDCGAGGYSSAAGEMGQVVGARVYLEKVPLKYPGLAPWEIFLSESQERMVIATDQKNLKKVLEIAKLYNVEATVIGNFDGSKKLHVSYKNKTVCSLNMDFLHSGLPQRRMVGRSKRVAIGGELPSVPKDLEKIFLRILSHGNVCSKEPIVRLYDHNVQGTNAMHPFGGVDFDAPNDGAIVRPILSKPYGVVVTHGLNPALNNLDPYWGSIWALTEAVSNFVAIGGKIKDAALIDNFIWPFPDEESLAALDSAVDALCFLAKILKMPFISGKDSLSSTYRYPDGRILKIPPVVLISVFGKIKDVAKTVSSDFKKVGSTIVLVGNPDVKNLGASAYFDITNSSSPSIPKVDTKNINKVLESISQAVESGQILSCHDISEGGVATTLAEMAFGGGCGASINIAKITKGRPDFVLFSETAGTFLVEVESVQIAKKAFAGVPHKIIGETQEEEIIEINAGQKTLLKTPIKKLKNAWQKPMKEIFHQ